jgi:hypothetical protein
MKRNRQELNQANKLEDKKAAISRSQREAASAFPLLADARGDRKRYD